MFIMYSNLRRANMLLTGFPNASLLEQHPLRRHSSLKCLIFFQQHKLAFMLSIPAFHLFLSFLSLHLSLLSPTLHSLQSPQSFPLLNKHHTTPHPNPALRHSLPPSSFITPSLSLSPLHLSSSRLEHLLFFVQPACSHSLSLLTLCALSCLLLSSFCLSPCPPPLSSCQKLAGSSPNWGFRTSRDEDWLSLEVSVFAHHPLF